MNKRQKKKKLKQKPLRPHNYIGDYYYTHTRDYFMQLSKELNFRYPNDTWNSCITTSALANTYVCIWGNCPYGLSCTSWYLINHK